MPRKWAVGDLVTPNLERAWVHDGTEFEAIMSKPRIGYVAMVPLATQQSGHGTLLVNWQSMTSQPLARKEWWTHSDLILRLE